MRKKQFKAESKKLLDMMINSIYTHNEIFLRELISNASDAIDKLYYRSLSDNAVGMNRDDYFIRIEPNKEKRTLTVTDNGIGMTEEELENNLGTIAKSGSLNFKKENETDDVDIIGQFGVGFYSAFMVSDKVVVKSRAFGSDTAYCWTSEGVDGYTIEPCDMGEHGTVITLYIKQNTEEVNYDDFLDQYGINRLVKKYSDYIRYPIKMEFENRKLKEGSKDEYETVYETRTMNSMVPLWKKNKNEITEEEYNNFYKEKFFDYSDPIKVIHSKTEGRVTYDALLFIPAKPPFDYYSKDYEKGLQLYSNGVMITEKCSDLLPDYFSFVKGLVDSADISLNISREMLQHDYQLKLIAKNIEKKIKNELENMLKNAREKYERFFKTFGTNLKFGVYNNYGMNKDMLVDLLLFTSSNEKKLVSLKEYVAGMKEGQDTIYYACGETVDKIDMLPQTDMFKDKGYEILYLTENVDEFAVKMLGEYDGKKFANICADNIDISSDEEKEELKKENEDAQAIFDVMSKELEGKVKAVRFTNKLKNHPVCLTSEGEISLEMEKVLNSMPTDQKVKADLVLEINSEHPIAEKLKQLSGDEETLKKYSEILYSQACLIGGRTIDDPTGLSNLICELMV